MARLRARRLGLFESILALAFASISIAFALSDAYEPWAGQGDTGFTVEIGGRVASVEPGSAAAAAGLERGDLVNVAAMPPEARRYLVVRPPAGLELSVPFTGRSGAHVLDFRVPAFERTAFAVLNVIVADVVALILPIFALVLVFLRPSGLTWALLLYAAIGSDESGTFNTYAPLPLFVVMKAYADLLWYSLWIVVFAFVLRFPSDRLDGVRRRADRLLRAALVVVLCCSAYVTLWPVFANPAAGEIAYVLEGLNRFGAAGALLTLFIGLLRADPRDRPRIAWVLAGFALGLGGQLLAGVPSLGDFPLVLNLAVPLSIAYAIRHRVIDVRFALSRALVYGVLTTCAILALGGVHYFVTKEFEEFKFGFLVDLGGAMAIGWGIQFVHKWIEELFDRFVFRDVRDAEERLEEAAAAMLHARSEASVGALLCTQSAKALRLASAALFLVDDVSDEEAPFVRRASFGWDGAALDTFASEDPLVLFVKGREAPVNALELLGERPGLPPDSGAPVLALPLVLRHRTTGFVLFGAHENGSDLDPDERKMLERLTHAAASAIEHALVEQKISENVALRSENALLRSITGRPPSAAES